MHNSKKLGLAEKFVGCKCPKSPPYSSYIISIAIANNMKAKFYDVDIPALENVRHDCGMPNVL